VLIKQLFATNNNCYKAGGKLKPKGIMVHSTGANNPYLKRYVQPDDGLLGKHPYDNHFNVPLPGGRQVCVHAFIGKLQNGQVACYQTLPFTMRGWHAGGKANDTHIGFEICEDGLTDPVYFNKVYNTAVELCIMLCKQFNLTEKDIIDHSEGFKRGIASNHGDVKIWFSKHGKTMDMFREDVRRGLIGNVSEQPVSGNPITVNKPTLRIGDRGQYVVELQNKLNSLNINVGKADGIFGTKTQQGVIAFQKARNLVPDGIVGVKTWTELEKILSTPAPKPQNGKLGIVTASALNIRQKPSITAPKAGFYKQGEKIIILNEQNGWYLTDRGFVSAQYVRLLNE
jgi:N-acetylmuramoyl-L-alanine amidase